MQEVETSITSSIEMLVKNPILILFYFLRPAGDQLAVDFVHIRVRPDDLGQGVIGRNLKKRSSKPNNSGAM